MIVLLSLLCYSAGSVAALEHSFPMLKQEPAEPVSSVMVAMNDEIEMNCHSPETPPCGNPDSTACKAFCSAMSQVAAIIENSIPLDSISSTSVTFTLSSVLSHQLPVEPHPPK